MAEVDRDLDAAVATYRPLVVFPDELRGWQRVQADIDRLRPAIGETVAVRRRTATREAEAQLDVVDVEFARANDDLARLIDINRQGGLAVVAQRR